MHAPAFLLAPFVLLSASAGEDTPATPQFAEPVQLTRAGEHYTGILYPSPALHDLDGDDAPELVIGDLPGRVVYCDRVEGSDLAWSAPRSLESEGEPLELDNW